ncbi:MAG: RNA-binding protein [Chlamydiales bacterium]
MKIYVGNLPFSYTDANLKDLFSNYDIVSAQVIIDRETGRSKGFGFVEVSSKEEGAKAIGELDKKEINGKEIRVNEARPFTPRKREDSSFGNKRRFR